MERLQIMRTTVEATKFLGERLIGGAFGSLAESLNIQPVNHEPTIKVGE